MDAAASARTAAAGRRVHRFALQVRGQPGWFQPHQAHTAWPMTRSLSRSDSQGSSSVNIVTHCRQEHGIFVMSVPQNMRAGPNAS
jgi:hypothetical protein